MIQDSTIKRGRNAKNDIVCTGQKMLELKGIRHTFLIFSNVKNGKHDSEINTNTVFPEKIL